MNQHTTPGTIRHKAAGKLLRKRKRSGKAPGGQPGRRKQWAGQELPAYPDELAQKPRSQEKPQPSLAELCEALAAPSANDFATIWLKRLAVRDPARYKAISTAWPTGGRAALYGLTYTSVKPCGKCQQHERIALSGRCQHCYKTVRFGKPTKSTPAELDAAARKRAEKDSALALIGSGTHYAVPADPHGIKARIGEATNGTFQISTPQLRSGEWTGANHLATPEMFHRLLRHVAMAALHQWACNNGPLPEGYTTYTDH